MPPLVGLRLLTRILFPLLRHDRLPRFPPPCPSGSRPLGTSALFSGPDTFASETALTPPPAGKTPALSAAEIAAIDAAMGKKGTYVEAQATHLIGLPRNDLKIKIKGEPVPIPFGFGGWVAIKHTLDGKSAMLMSDTVLLQEEVNPLMSAALANGLEIGAVHNHFL